MRFKVGDIVYLKRSSRFFCRTYNPDSEETQGRIIDIREYGFPIRVEWRNGGRNVYNEEDLAIIGEQSENKKYKNIGLL